MSMVMTAFFLLLIIGVPISFVVLGSSALGILSQGNNPIILIQQLYKGINNFTLLAVPFFIISGDIAARGLTSRKIVDVINAFLGRVRGGLGIATIFACVFFGAITGSAMATVVAIGALMMPILLERGYPRSLTIGILTTAGTLGVMIPPSVPMLTICVAMQSSVGAQFTAGFIPGLLTAGAFSIFTYFAAKKHNIPLEPKISFRQKLRVVKDSFWALMFPVIILGGIYGGVTTPTEAAVVSVLYVIAVEFLVYKVISPREMLKIIAKSAANAGALTLTIAASQVFVWYMTTAQIPAMLYDMAVGFFTNKYILLLVLCVLFFIVGCFTNVATVVIILGPMLMPVLTHFGVNFIHFGIVAIMMSQIGFVTPPFGLCLFVSMRVTGAAMGEVTKAAVPFLLIMLAVTALLVVFPEISLFLPRLIYPNV